MALSLRICMVAVLVLFTALLVKRLLLERMRMEAEALAEGSRAAR
jgi:hypothetical protein